MDYKSEKKIIEHIRYHRTDEVIELINSGFITSDKFEFFLDYAVTYNHDELVLYFIYEMNVDPTFKKCWAFRCAAQTGNLRLINIFLKDDRINPTASNNYAIRLAAQHEHFEIAKILFNIKSVRDLLKINIPELYSTLNQELVAEKIQGF